MKHHAKALAAGSISATGRHGRSVLAILALAICALALTAAPALAEPPTVLMGTVSDASYGSAHVSGEIDTGGFGAEYFFEVSTNDVDWSSAHVEGELSEAPGLQSVEGTITGLKGGTKYFVRLGAYNFDFSNFVIVYSSGPDPEFTTLPVDPPSVVAVDDAANALYTVADLKGKVKRPEGNADPAFDVECNFEYVTDDQFNATGFEGATPIPCAPPNPVKAEGTSDVSAKLTGLAMGTTYHLRLHAENAGGSDSKVAADTFTTLSSPPAPSVQVDPVTTFTDAGAHLSGSVNPNGTDPALNSAWHFQCVPACGEPGGTVAADGSEHAVSADISGLEPNTSYEAKLVATNAGGPDEASTSFKTAFLAPLAQTGFASEVEAHGATLSGTVNPHNATATYSFEYGLDESYGRATPVVTLGEVDNVRHAVSRQISGLAPEATYHFRLSATNTESVPPETTHGEDHTFTTPPASGSKACPNEQLRAENNSLGLPDCRAYEMVSPVRKSGSEAGGQQEAGVAYGQATADGDGILYGVTGPMGIARRGIENYAVSRRGDNGWSTESAIPSGGSSQERVYTISYAADSLLPSADLSTVVFAGTGSWVPQNPQKIPGQGGSAGLYLGHSDDSVDWLSEPQIPFADSSPSPGEIYLYCQLRPIGGTPDLSTVYFWSQPNLLPGEAARASSGGWGLYEYTNGVLSSAETLPPTAEHPEGVEPSGGAAPASSGDTYRGTKCGSTSSNNFGNEVSRDGSTLFFVSPDPGTLEQGGPVTQLYVRRAGHSTLISRMPDGSPAPDGASAVTPLRNGADTRAHQFAVASPDGKTAIFQSHDALTPTAPPGGGTYRYQVDSDTITYLPEVKGSVAAISDDGTRFLFEQENEGGYSGFWANGLVRHDLKTTVRDPARVNASGSVFIYTGFADPQSDFNAGRNIAQIFRYDADTGQTTCLSCPPDGTQPTGYARLSERDIEEGVTPPSTDGEPLGNRGISTDGNRVFFDTPDPLLAQDTNHVRDVYEWTPSGLSLISSGKGTTASYVLENSANGDDVFFSTAQTLDPRDTDGLYDVYDARVEGGFRQTRVVSPCSENATCKDAAPGPPTQPGPTTNSFSGPGNPAPCPKGKVRKHGSCVKQKTRKHKHQKKKSHKRAGHNRGGSK